jgi:pimeloyl-ACP methyl ester carboxylesterase
MIANLRGIVARLAAGGVLIAAGLGYAAPTASLAATAARATYSGTLPNGATWQAEVPAGWNGTLLLFSHGYRPSFAGIPNTPQIAPDTATREALLARGYALTGSSYAATGWALNTAVADQLATLTAAGTAIGRRPSRVLAYGASMGGLVTAKLAETAGGRVQGALPACGIVGGADALGNYQLDGALALSRLLTPGTPVPLVRYATVAEAFAVTTTLTTAATLAQATPAGRARISLAAALYQMPSWRPGAAKPTDAAGVQRGQYEWLLASLPLMVPGRFDIETSLGGNPSWNKGIDYRRLLGQAASRGTVRELYRAAGLNLGADLDALTAAASTRPDRAAVRHVYETSVPFGGTRVPVLTIHTTDDNLVPVQHESGYGNAVRRAGRGGLLRQAYVARPGHCAFSAAEWVAGVLALEHRVGTGRWDGAASTAELQRVATGLGLGGAAFADFTPPRLLRESFVPAPR